MPADLRSIALTTADGRSIDAAITTPDGPGPWPAIVVIHEIFGIDDEMHKHLRHLARMGYIAVMPNLYAGGGMARCLAGTLRSLRTGRGRAYADIEAARHYLLSDAECTGTEG
jgi:carboxymethylenebutenolidase